MADASDQRRARSKADRGVRYARMIINAHHVSQARVLSPYARLVRIMPPTVFPRRYARRPRLTLRSHDRQRTSLKLSVHAAALYSPSSQVSTLPKAKSETRSMQNKDMHKCSSVHSERGVPLPVLTSSGE